MTIQALHDRAVRVARDYLRCEAELLEIFQEFDRTKGFRSLGYGSLYEYALSLGLSEGTAYSLITVARKSIAVPELKQSVAAGTISLSNARRIAPILTQSNQEAWLEKAKTLPKAQLERALAKEFPKEAAPERIKPVTETHASLRVTLSNALLEKLKRVQDLESQRTQRAAKFEDALEAMVDAYLERKDPTRTPTRTPVTRAQRRDKSEQGSQAKLDPGLPSASPALDAHGKRRAIPAAIQRQVWRRDQGQCSARTPGGERCESRRWLQLHHLKEVAKGGEHAAGNLALLCSAHHAGEHGGVG